MTQRLEFLPRGGVYRENHQVFQISEKSKKMVRRDVSYEMI